MSVAFVGPNSPMGIGDGRVALWTNLRRSSTSSDPETNGASPTSIGNVAAWWDASSVDGLRGPGGNPIMGWNLPVASVVNKCGGGWALTPYSVGVSVAFPVATPRLNGRLGGIGLVSGGTNTLAPALDPDLGFAVTTLSYSAGASWTCYLVWSRPNWRQNSGRDASPVTLLTLGSSPILQADSFGGGSRLVLFPGVSETVLFSALERRHTHSIVLRYTAGGGIDAWLDATQVASAAPVPQGFTGGSVVLLHDTTAL